MKKTLTVLLALVLSLSAVSLAAADATRFPSDLLDGMNWSAEDWTGTETGAAAFIDLSIVALCGNDGFTSDDFDLTNGAYVFLSDGETVGGGVALSSGKGIDFFYIPSLKYAAYARSDYEYTESMIRFTAEALADVSGATNARYIPFSKLLEILQLLAGD